MGANREVRVVLTVDVSEYIEAIKRARHETIRLGQATKWARKQERKLRKEGEIESD
jgi:hypothetical protein